MSVVAKIEHSSKFDTKCITEKLIGLGYEAISTDNVVYASHNSRTYNDLKKALSSSMLECKVSNSMKMMYGSNTLSVAK